MLGSMEGARTRMSALPELFEASPQRPGWYIDVCLGSSKKKVDNTSSGNPYHDERGRFSSGEGASSKAVDTESLQSEISEKEYSSKQSKLASSPVTKKEYLEGGSNRSYMVTLENGEKGVWKPKDGEDHNLRFYVPNDTYYKREAAASTIAAAVGMQDLVPATTIREVDGRIGSVQEFSRYSKMAQEVEPEQVFDGKEDLARAATFDYLIANSDRHMKNWMLHADVPLGTQSISGSQFKKLVLIDNGLSLPTNSGGGGNWDIMTAARFEGSKIPDLSFMKSKWPKLETDLKTLGIEKQAIDLTKQRLDTLIEHKGERFSNLPKIFEGWEGPAPGEGNNSDRSPPYSSDPPSHYRTE
jgi:hypothetical protein